MQISTSVLPTLIAVTSMRCVAMRLDRTHARVKQDLQAMEKKCSGKLLWQCQKLLSKRFKCDSMSLYLLYSLSTRKNVKKKGKEKETKMDMT